ncbi:MAG: alpha/beta fold hydrolase [Phycisphaerae bacterium]|nr:alpha/beta fold hydrolase [Phycisphaerae bacterium]
MARVAGMLALLVLPVAASEPESRTVSYKTPDGVEIVADYYAPKSKRQGGAPVVILLHQYPSTRSSWRPLAPLFHEAGYAVLAPDLRGHGDSVKPEGMKLAQGKESRSPKHYREAYQDVFGAYEWLRTRKEVDLSRLAIVGASIGTSVAIDYAARDPSVDVVVCLSPGPEYFGVDSRRHIAKYGDRPILLISPDNERDRSEALGAIDKAATVKIIKDSDQHGTFMFGKVPGIEKTVFEFVHKHIGGPAENPVVASLKSDKYHQPMCRYATPDPGNRYAVRQENLRVFSSAGEAAARGYKPCRKCCK